MGKPIYAIADGEVTSIHNHTTKPTFGNHIHYVIKGEWGERYIHHAHCQEIFVKIGDFIKEGQKIAAIGNSGTEWAHDHWACKKEPTGIDGLATTLERLKLWEDPLVFVNQWIESGIIPVMNDQTLIPANLLNSKDFPVDKDSEIQALRGWLGDYGRVKMQIISLETEIEVLDSRIRDLQSQLDKQLQTIGLMEKDLNIATAFNAPKTADSFTKKELIIALINRIFFPIKE